MVFFAQPAFIAPVVLHHPFLAPFPPSVIPRDSPIRPNAFPALLAVTVRRPALLNPLLTAIQAISAPLVSIPQRPPPTCAPEEVTVLRAPSPPSAAVRARTRIYLALTLRRTVSPVLLARIATA